MYGKNDNKQKNKQKGRSRVRSFEELAGRGHRRTSLGEKKNSYPLGNGLCQVTVNKEICLTAGL